MTQRNVTVYTSPGCGVCTTTKGYLKSKGVAFEELDITANHDAFEELTGKYKSRGTPTIVIGDQVLIGFDKDKLERALEDR